MNRHELNDLLTECQQRGMPGVMVSYAQLRALRAEVERLTAERDRYKAWHDDQVNRNPDGWLCISADGSDMQAACRTFVRDDYARFGRTIIDLIVRPQPLKENE